MAFQRNPLNKPTKKRWKYTWLKSATDQRKVLGANRFLGSKYAVAVIGVIYPLFLFFIGNYLMNFLQEVKEWLQTKDSIAYGLGTALPDMKRIFGTPGAGKVYLGFLGIILVLDLLLIYRIRVNYSEDYFNVRQKGDARWTTREEIQAQYRSIPMDGSEYDGPPGTIVYRWKDRLYIDRGNTNNIIVGMTRSGKGEMYVFNSIDIQSRSKVKPSMVINDPKMELYKSAKGILTERGYRCYLMRLNDPLHSMGMDPLKICVDTYKKKDYSNAELLAQTFAYSIFNPDDAPGESAFFAKTAAALLCALIIAHVEDCLGEDERINQKRLESWRKKRKIFRELKAEDQESIQAEVDRWRKENPFLDPISEAGFWCLPPTVPFTITHEEEKKINVYSIINTFIELASIAIPNTNKTMLDSYFEERPALDRAKMKYAAIGVAGGRTKGSIFADMLSKVGIFTFENIAKMTAESSFDLEELGYGEKPIAVFLAPPDYDASNHFLATVFIRQMYFVLAKKASDSKTGKIDRPVKCILDEYGNMPSIENMHNIITVCLGRGISFDMYIHSYTQLNERYGDMVAKIIEGNCGNQIYILTSDEDTTQKFSSLLGEESIVTLQRSGSRHSLDKNITEMIESKPLLNKNQLMELLEGECAIRRMMQRTDLEGNPVRPTPIFLNREEGTYLEYRYRDSYLSKLFPNPNEIDLDEISREDRNHINLKERVWDPAKTFRILNGEGDLTVERIKDLEKEEKEKLLAWLKKYSGKKAEELEESTMAWAVEFLCCHENMMQAEEKEKLFAICQIVA